MFNREKSEYWGNYSLTVGKLIDALSKYDKDTVVSICGDSEAYLHIEEDLSEIDLDNISAENIEE